MCVCPAGEDAPPSLAKTAFSKGAALIFSIGQQIGHEVLPDMAHAACAELDVDGFQAGVIGDDARASDGANLGPVIDGNPDLPAAALGIGTDQGCGIAAMRPRNRTFNPGFDAGPGRGDRCGF